MFVLRIITEQLECKEGPKGSFVENRELGNFYKVLRRGNTKDFDAIVETSFKEFASDIEALIVPERRIPGTSEVIPLFGPCPCCTKTYYVMTENGQTFEKL